MPKRMLLIGVLGFGIPTMLGELLDREHRINSCRNPSWKTWRINANEQ